MRYFVPLLLGSFLPVLITGCSRTDSAPRAPSTATVIRESTIPKTITPESVEVQPTGAQRKIENAWRAFEDPTAVTARPAPDLTTLAQRSSPETQLPDSSEAFMDLLKLREIADAKDVPILEKILVENLPTGRIHRFAAAQALFSIGTPQAHQILAQHVFAKETHAGQAVGYTSGWDMQEPMRSRYIEKYLLKNLAKDLVVEVEQTPATPQPSGHLNLVVTFRNASDEAFHILDHKSFPGDMLYLRDATGYDMPRIHCRRMCFVQPTYIELKPSQAHRVNVTIDIAAIDSQKELPATTGTLTAVVRESGHFYDIQLPGRFEVLALLEAEPLTDEVRKFFKVGQDWKMWTGRPFQNHSQSTSRFPFHSRPKNNSQDSDDSASRPSGTPTGDIMCHFFCGWRRKVGCVTLVMALAIVGIWIRSFQIHDRLWLQFPTAIQLVYSYQGCLLWQGDRP